MREGLVKAEATNAGKMFVDFQGYAIDGKPSRLSDYVGKGKYVLVDFWASWCGPCKGEIPNLIELQNKFGGEKFMVLGVNVWDDETAFKAALEEEGITYPQIVVPQNNKDNATELYGIKGIPQIILFAPDGTIVKRDLRGQAMKDLVEEKMKK
jgi:thiol-disulfide isomerase/thioredoxin